MLRNPSSILKACAAFALLQVINNIESLRMSKACVSTFLMKGQR